MSIESPADRAVFLDAEEFGVLGTYTAAAGGSALLAGILDRPTIELAGEHAPGVDFKPTFLCASGDIPDTAIGDAGDTLQIGAVTLQVISLQPDGTGMTRIHLGK